MARSNSSALALVAVVALVAATGAFADCSLPASCAWGVEFGEDLSGYANTTVDVKEFRELLLGAAPDFASALSIYVNGKHAFRGANLPRNIQRLARSNYGQEPYYALASAYYNSTFYLDEVFFGPALKGEGEFAGACCGVRAETARALALWYSGAYSLHESNAGLCFATGCNNRSISAALAGEEVLHGMALMTGADGAGITNGPAGTSNTATLFQISNNVSLFFCTKKKKDALSPLNNATIEAVKAASKAAIGTNGVPDVAGLNAHYKTIEGLFVARFLTLSLEQAREATKRASKANKAKADACRKDCLRESQQAAARIYWKAAAPIVARDQPALAEKVNTLLNGATFFKKYPPLAKLYKAIVAAYSLNGKKVLAKCKA